MSTYSTNLALELIGTGEQAGTWGVTTNSNLGTLIEQAISGYVTQAVSTGTDTTITIPNGSSGVARNMYIELTGTGGASTNLIVPANKKLYFIFNNSTGAVTVKVSGQTGVSVPTGKKMVLVSNGTDIVNGLNYIADFASNSATITHLSATSASITNLTLTSLVISNLSIASANITTLTGSTQTLSGNLTLSGGTANGVLYLNGSKVATSGSALTFDGTNLGIGVTPSAWLSTYKGIDITNYGSIYSRTATNSLEILTNAYRNSSSNYIYKNDGTAQYIEAANGAFAFYNAASGTAGNTVSFTQAMTLNASGNLGIGTASPVGKLQVTGSLASFILNTSGTEFYNNYAGQVKIYASNAAGFLSFGASGRDNDVVLSTTGNLGIGTASPGSKLDVNGNGAFSGTLTATLPSSVGAIVARNSSTTASELAVRPASGKSGWLSFTEETVADRWIVGITNGNGGLFFKTGNPSSNTDRMVLDSSGNLGLGVTPSAWFGNSKVIQFGSGGSLEGRSNLPNLVQLSANAYIDSSGNTRYLNTAAASSYLQYLGAHSWYTAASGTAGNAISFTQAMTLDASGNLLVGGTGGGNRLVVSNTTDISMSSGAAGQARFEGNGYSFAIAMNTDGAALYTNSAARGIIFGTDETERARITSGGDLLVGDTSGTDARVKVDGTGNAANCAFWGKSSGGSAGPTSVIWNNATSGDNKFIDFYTEASATLRGSITYNRAGGLVAYNVTSDYRAKDILGPVQNSGATIDALKVYEGQMKGASQSRPMLVAHEAQEHAPYTVTGEKDAVNEDGTPKYQQMDVSALVPLLLAEVQSLRKRVAELESK